ncbi:MULTISPECIES: Bug family tripartite tricarboxylate transporter substrate binding protein [unclassified Cupriavidus]|uniref:Bug family tripartite tricarboxylate transporter substrate binding protein n=1 Tax=unclassified Cupriavidus TaxID=2640874 RepID=UPI0008912424|nr:tripartite tricarboxylate transporter substrate binding protein [Cupriavidus sp. YR651]SDC72622.1 Tripartite-type tricarboxylate transporter, receptor component TctC [Cupriavidus sp. YR651]
MKKAAILALLGGAVLSGAVEAQPQAYPNKPIRMVVPYAAGGAADITARVVGQKMAETLGVPVVVENRGGANGNIGTDAVAKAAPDGYTLLLVASGPIVVNPSLYAKVPYDPIKDLAPVSQITTYQYALVVAKNSPIRNVQDLIRMAKASPGKLSYGSTGIGGGGHLAGELFGTMTGTQLTHVPYKGSAPALADLLGGQLSFTFDTVVTTVPQIAGGKLRAFAVSGTRRAAGLPEVPTMSEIGYKGFDITQFQGLMVPARTDPAIIERLHQAVVQALKSPDVIRRLVTEGGNELVGSSPAEFAKVIRSESAMYAKLIKDANIKAD